MSSVFTDSEPFHDHETMPQHSGVCLFVAVRGVNDEHHIGSNIVVRVLGWKNEKLLNLLKSFRGVNHSRFVQLSEKNWKQNRGKSIKNWKTNARSKNFVYVFRVIYPSHRQNHINYRVNLSVYRSKILPLLIWKKNFGDNLRPGPRMETPDEISSASVLAGNTGIKQMIISRSINIF